MLEVELASAWKRESFRSSEHLTKVLVYRLLTPIKDASSGCRTRSTGYMDILCLCTDTRSTLPQLSSSYGASPNLICNPRQPPPGQAIKSPPRTFRSPCARSRHPLPGPFTRNSAVTSHQLPSTKAWSQHSHPPRSSSLGITPSTETFSGFGIAAAILGRGFASSVRLSRP